MTGGHTPWWRTSAKPHIVRALANHLDRTDAERIATEILDVLEAAGMRVTPSRPSQVPYDDGTDNSLGYQPGR